MIYSGLNINNEWVNPTVKIMRKHELLTNHGFKDLSSIPLKIFAFTSAFNF